MIIKSTPNKDFTVMRNAVLTRSDLSLKAKGLWAFLMTKPDGWQTTIRGLAAQLPEGKDAIMATLRELEAVGLYAKKRVNNKDGTFSWEDFVFDEPCPGLPYMDNPNPANPPQVNTDKVNTELRVLPKGNTSDSNKSDLSEASFSKLVVALGQSSAVRYLPGRKQKLKARLKNFTFSEILLAATNLGRSPYHTGDNPNNVRYATVDFLLRSDEQIDKWLVTDDPAAPPQLDLTKLEIR